jgi:FdhE protein
VADSFLGRWFGRQRGTAPEVEQLRAELDRLAAARPALKAPARWLREVLPDLISPSDSAPALRIEPDRVGEKLKAGIPLLRGEQVEVDERTFGQRWRRACAALEAQQPDPAAAALADAVQTGRLGVAEMLAAVCLGQPEELRERIGALGFDPVLATTLLRFTLFPLFTALEASAGPLRTGGWERGYCPTCGSWPLLGEFRGLDQSRFLRCGLCAAGWEVPRLWCPFCDNRDHAQLGLLCCEGEEMQYRASVCDGCRGYVKMITTLSALSPLQLLMADVATLHLDLAAAERGYTAHG